MRKKKVAIILAVCISLFGGSSQSMTVSAETYEYDALNRVTQVKYDDGSYLTYKYDANGNIEESKLYTKDGTEIVQDQDSNKNNTNNTEKKQINQQSDEFIVQSDKATYTIHIDAEGKGEATLNKIKDKNATSYTVANQIKVDGKAYDLTEIADNAFKNCTKLKKITIGKNIKRIGKNAFYKAKNLKRITVKTKVLKTVGKNALKGIHQDAVIKVPGNKLKLYKKLFKNKGQKKTVKIKK